MSYRLIHKHLTTCLFFGLLASLFAETSALARAKDLYYKGVDGDKAATRESSRLLERLAQETPQDPLVTAYLASNRLLESGRTFALWNKNRLAREGILGLDKAVSSAPENLEVRFVRALSTYDLPGFFKRQTQSEEDLAWLASRVGPAASQGRFEKHLAAAALYYHGLVREKKGDRQGALETWKSAASLAPDTKPGKAAAEKLR